MSAGSGGDVERLAFSRKFYVLVNQFSEAFAPIGSDEQVLQERQFLVRLSVSAHSQCPHPLFVLNQFLKNICGRAVVPANTPSLLSRLDHCERNDSLCRNRCAS